MQGVNHVQIRSSLSQLVNGWLLTLKQSKMFDYPYTCPTIDSGLESVKSEIESKLEDVLTEYRDNSEGNEEDQVLINGLVSEHADILYDEIANSFEEVRTSNSDMRDEAEKQLKELEDEFDTIVEEKEDSILELEARIQELEDEIEDLKNQ